ncbi:glutathione S-transferase [Labrys miyagiensis]|uniref:Glutathione S-transferase n=1 Tax=Labrys miyagiensis TaxID=346912 RepID=A0ABQ6CYK1_9HYPH|nr:glutathione S-transferase family protein [Labrys miyagiensis]GLS23774.1 glutathione S-transferase [Labrys miyagiensis]
MIIANKNYSSWSMRPWLAAKAAGIGFEEQIIWLRQPQTSANIKTISAAGKVPILIDGDILMHESIAILEYFAEIAPELWPQDREARAHARSIGAEMHAGFVPLRKSCPMNIKRRPQAIALDTETLASVERVVDLFVDCRARFGAGGDFLFGARFNNADAMFAPVVNRLHAYDIKVPASVRTYMDAVMATPMWREWEAAALDEAEIIADIDDVR